MSISLQRRRGEVWHLKYAHDLLNQVDFFPCPETTPLGNHRGHITHTDRTQTQTQTGLFTWGP